MAEFNLSDLFTCNCEAQYTIEPHGNGHVLYYGRCGHKHGWNLVYLNEPAANCDFKHIEKLLNLGNKVYWDEYPKHITGESPYEISKRRSSQV